MSATEKLRALLLAKAAKAKQTEGVKPDETNKPNEPRSDNAVSQVQRVEDKPTSGQAGSADTVSNSLAIVNEAQSVQQATPKVPTVVSTENVPTHFLEFKHKLMELEEALEERRTDFAYLLRDIHQTMSKQHDVITIMSEEEIGIVVDGLAGMKGVILGGAVTAKGTKARGKKVITADMI